MKELSRERLTQKKGSYDTQKRDKVAQIPGYEGLYSVDTKGRVFSECRMVKNRYGTYTYRKGLELRQATDKGYKRVTLYKNLEPKRHTVHQLVLLAFVGEPPKKTVCMHLDGCRENNRLSNLRYGSTSCNEAFKIDHGTLLTCEKHGSATITNEIAVEIVSMRRRGFLLKEISAKHKLSVATVGKICNGQLWAKATGTTKRTYRKKLTKRVKPTI